jgi:telomere length regulation protein
MSAQETLRETLDRLRAPVNDEETLISLLTIPLAPLGLTSSSAGDEAVLSIDAKLFLRYIPEYQTVLLQNVLPHWFDHLRDSGKLPIVTMYFMPKLVSGSLPPRHSSIPWNFAVMECIISAHSTLIVEPISQFSVDTLSTICRIHSPLDVFCYIFMNSHDPAARLSSERWIDYLHSLFSVVGRVSNASIDGKLNVPENLDTR